ncbi:hypothetical protein Poly51_10450 [Rubripirellula tenax]|uniref:Uncharacterized protein n=1 Tax=Rubripirellula tenax TaxID=2528015 RepID=A0A5C6FLR8_9BACT|nr:hypothetical protein [Rubripirellula tenax]TWU60764.1 hypothetical protein Poly51_10450 [Rubripirellula tenax]
MKGRSNVFHDNPYQPASDLLGSDPRDQASDVFVKNVRRSAWPLFVIWGFVVGASLPVALGLFQLHSISVYNASLPPGTATCGNPVVGALALIFFLGPFGGFVGAVIGGAISAVTVRR